MDIHAHFHPDERYFVDKAWDWVLRATERNVVKTTDFLDPRQAFILQSLINRQPDTALFLFGGYAEAERKRAIIGPEYIHPLEEQFEIALLSVSSDDPHFASLDHGDFLGALLGLGIKREKIGDIQVFARFCHCLVATEISSYIDLQLRQVHRVHVQTEVLPLDRLQFSPTAFEEMNFTVASLRLDAVVSDVYRLSRAKVMDPIRAGRCRVNWKPEEDPSKQLKKGDIVSFQGFGRFKVLEAEGLTKKGRIHVKIGKYV